MDTIFADYVSPVGSRAPVVAYGDAPLKPFSLPAGEAAEIVELADSASTYYPIKQVKAELPKTDYAPVGRALLNTAWAITSMDKPKTAIPTIQKYEMNARKAPFSATPFIIGGAAVLLGLVLYLRNR